MKHKYKFSNSEIKRKNWHAEIFGKKIKSFDEFANGSEKERAKVIKKVIRESNILQKSLKTNK